MQHLQKDEREENHIRQTQQRVEESHISYKWHADTKAQNDYKKDIQGYIFEPSLFNENPDAGHA